VTASEPVPVGLLGATSLVGTAALRQAAEWPTIRLVPFSRGAADEQVGESLRSYRLPQGGERLPVFLSLMPVWALAERLPMLAAYGCERLVVLSSTSRFTKADAYRPDDRELAHRLEHGEKQVLAWADDHDVACTIVRPTMIYGTLEDGNVSAIASASRRFRVFPVVGAGRGLRQPVHVEDVAWAGLRLAAGAIPARRDYNLSGGETLTYRTLVRRVQRSVPGPTATIRVPLGLFRLAARVAPRSRTVRVAAGMAERMNQDLVFDHKPATHDFGYRPRPFQVTDGLPPAR
jgi:nucleoside-diphosphate-sugar epimerase